ncbi:hypothetical protein Btru_064575 [Bulinus truncatus]|nr:hypothetical protein Btru_064575 [Bulinus truncatus]
MAFNSYSNAQKIAFAGLTIGFLMCTVGCIAPFWYSAKLSTNTLSDLFKWTDIRLPSVDLVTMRGGLWWFCVDTLVSGKECQTYELGEADAKDWIVRGAAVLNVFLALMCALAALCRSCCCQGGKTVCHGVMAFIAGASGFTAVGIFVSTESDGFAMKLKLEGFDWAFFVYAAGCAVITIVSFILCFASPMNPFAGVIINGVSHIMPNGYSRMPNDQVAMQQPTEIAFVPPESSRY